VAATLVLWAGFRFTFGSLSEYAERPYHKIDRLTGSRGPAHNAAYAVVESKWIPAMPLLKGVAQMEQKERFGQKSFLLGHIRSSGWWYFFLVALAVKTPLPLLILAAAGWLSVLRTSWAKKNWIPAAPAIAAAAILLIVIPQNLSIGVRHVLPIYPSPVCIHRLLRQSGIESCRSAAVPRAGAL
jgi:hypothetical protein